MRLDKLTVHIVRQLSQYGVFVGSIAYVCYANLLRIPEFDPQQDPNIDGQTVTIAAPDIPSLLEIIRTVDATFTEIDEGDHRHNSDSHVYRNSTGLRVEWLIQDIGNGGDRGTISLLDFLLHDSIKAVFPAGDGVPVTVPAPGRFVVYTLINAARHSDDETSTEISRRERDQAIAIAETMIERRFVELTHAFRDGWKHSPQWRGAIVGSLTRLDNEVRQRLQTALAAGIRLLEADSN